MTPFRVRRYSLVANLPIPKGLNRIARGCRFSGYPGIAATRCHFNPERVV